jgi:5-methylcytosine-specific restriction endonuclease McrA
MAIVHCEWCSKEQKVTPFRAATYRFCSIECRNDWRKVHWTGARNPLWQAGERTKVCQHCGGEYSIKDNQPITTFRKQRFCSHECGVLGRNTTAEHNPNWKGGHSNRSAKQHKWATNVISRDGATCQHCGATGVELHAHHIKSFKDYPELRWDLSNGLTLCHRCHWAEHAAIDANAVNSEKPLADNAEGNPEPSPSGNIREGVTTRGRAYRRVEANCPTCGKFVSKRLSDAKGKAFIACSRSCATKHSQVLRKRQRQ